MTAPVTYLINLDGSDDRLAAARDELASVGLDALRVPAVDGRGRPPSSFPEYDAPAARAYTGRDLLGAEVACYLSHVACAERFLATQASHALVLEDDVVLAAGFTQHLTDALAWLHAHRAAPWYLLNVGSPALKLGTALTTLGEHTLWDAHYFPMTTAAILWTRPGAEAFMRERGRIWAPVDHFLRHWLTRNARGVAIYPPLARQRVGRSEIEGAAPRTHSSGSRGVGYFLRKQRRTLVGNAIAWRHLIATRLGRR
jgi:glycosyl transferase, family 25